MKIITVEIDLDATETIIEQNGEPTAMVRSYDRYQTLRDDFDHIHGLTLLSPTT